MVVEASIPGLMRTLVIILVIWFVVRLFMKFMAAHRATQVAQEQMRQQMARQEQQRRAQERDQRTVRDDGRTRVEYTDPNSSKNSKGDDPGEYVDYEILD